MQYRLTFGNVPFTIDQAQIVKMQTPGSLGPIESQPSSQRPPLKYQAESDLLDEINRLIPFRFLQEYSYPSAYPGRNLGAVANYWSNEPSDCIKVGNYYYPVGANKWSVFRGLATSAQAKAMLLATGGTSPVTFILNSTPDGAYTPGTYEISTQMYMLPPRPLAEHANTLNGLYLITLVDERFFWQGSPITLKITKDTTWNDLITQLSSTLGITINYSAISSVYSKPEADSQLWTQKELAPTLLDAIAYNLGRKLVRSLDGTYSLLTPRESLVIANNNRGTQARLRRLAGGDMFYSGGSLPIGNLRNSRNIVLPRDITITYPKYAVSDPVPHFLNERYQNQRPSCWYEESPGSVYSVTIPITSGGVFASGLTGTGNEFIHNTAKALYSGEASVSPYNEANLLSLSLQIAQDYYDAQATSALDEVYPGTLLWTPEGLHDIVWTFSAKERLASCRVMRFDWNKSIKEMQHATPETSGFTNHPIGIGGPSVAQAIRDSFSGNITSQVASGPVPSGSSYFLVNDVSYFPTDNRWRASVNGENVLFEGTSGGTLAGSGYLLSVAYRGIDGTTPREHASGSVITLTAPHAAYGVNLTTYGKAQHVYPSNWTSGGIQGINIVPQTQTVQVYSESTQDISGTTYYQGKLNIYQPQGGSFTDEEFVWIKERNNNSLIVDRRYDGQFAGYVGNQPTYLVNENPSSGQDFTSGEVVDHPIEICGYLFYCCTQISFSGMSNPVSDYSLSTVFSGSAGRPMYSLTAASGGTTLTGIEPVNLLGSGAGQIIGLVNDGEYPIIMTNADSSSTADNRFSMPPAWQGSLVLEPRDSVVYWRDLCTSGSVKNWRMLSTTVEPYRYNGSGDISIPTGLEICGAQYWCCKAYTFPSSSVSNWDAPTTPGRATVYTITPNTGGTTLTSIIPATLHSGYSLATSGALASGGGPYGPQFIALTNVQSGNTLTINDVSTGPSIPSFGIRLPPSYGSYVTLQHQDSIGLWYDKCTSGGTWRTLFCTVAPTGFVSGGGAGAPSCVRARRNSNQTLATNSGQEVIFDNVDYDTDNYWAAGSGGILLAQSGFYDLGATVEFTNGGTAATELKLELRMNGTTISQDSRPQVTPGGMAGPTACTINAQYVCNSGGKFQLFAYQDTGGNLDINANEIAMWMHRIN